MSRLLLLLGALCLAAQVQAQTTIRVFNQILYYDGYAARVDSPPPPAGVIRHRNDLYARKLTDTELASIGNTLHIKVLIKASCDNYDRIGNVNLAFVHKGDTAYTPGRVPHLELARYITPFMNKNRRPDTVPYNYVADNVARILRDSALRASYDFWMELQVFGVPYAAQNEITGCAGRNDVFFGTLDLITDSAAAPVTDNMLLPLNFQKNLNNYQASATDTLTKTTRTIAFDVTQDLSDATLYLITSNHGADTLGEEYNRRYHYVYVDDTLRLTYKPGRTTCEPFRRYNTQPNGIYGSRALSAAQWQSFSNWCPGDVITTREIPLGGLTAGRHKFLIRVPTAVFYRHSGYFPVSLYLQGTTVGRVQAVTGTAPAVARQAFRLYPNPAGQTITVEGADGAGVTSLALYNAVGARVYTSGGFTGTKATLQLGALQPGLYLLHLHTPQGLEVHKVQISGAR